MRDLSGSLRKAYLEQFRPQRLLGRSGKTHYQYLVNLRHFDKHLGREATIADLTDESLAAVMAAIIDRGCTHATANKFRAHIVALWRYLSRKGVVEQWPNIPPLKEPTRIPRAWTAQQLAVLFAACKNTVGMIDGVRACRWWVALHCVAWDTAERIGALLSLRWSDLNLDAGWVIVRAETRKGRTGDKLSRLHPHTVAALRAIEQPAREYVFPWPYCSALLWRRYRLMLERAGLPSDRWSKFHRLRKSVATHLKVAGGDPTEALDHSNPKTTKAYIDPTIAHDQHPADVLFRPEDWKRPRDAG